MSNIMEKQYAKSPTQCPDRVQETTDSVLTYHAGENGLWSWGGFGLVGGVTTLISPCAGVWGAGCVDDGLPPDDGVWGLGTATLRGPVTDKLVATSGGLWASLRLSESLEIPPSDNLDPSDSLDNPSGSWCCGCGWWSMASCGCCGCNLGGWSPKGSGNLIIKE